MALYYAMFNTNSEEFVNTWTVLAFESRRARDAYVERADCTGTRRVGNTLIAVHAVNERQAKWAARAQKLVEANGKIPFGAAYWLRPLYEDWDDSLGDVPVSPYHTLEDILDEDEYVYFLLFEPSDGSCGDMMLRDVERELRKKKRRGRQVAHM